MADDSNLVLLKMPQNCRNISDEVFPGIFVGDKAAAKNTNYLKGIGISHVLNTAEGSNQSTVNTNQDFYTPYGIKYKGLRLSDDSNVNIALHFKEVADFIEGALQEKGSVLVNCQKGLSRSSTCVLAFLMLKRNMTAVAALAMVRASRDVRPNNGFLRQLAELDNQLRRERGLLSK